VGVRTCVRLLKPERGIGFATGRRGGVTAELGSMPWAAASAASAVGRCVRDGCTGVVFRASQNATCYPLAIVRAF
jgi:hypothetical protein